MSGVRLCDSCGVIFAEGAEGSATGSVTVMVRGSDGRTRPENRVQDSCPKCVGGAQKRAEGGRIQLAIISGTTDVAEGQTKN